MNAWPAKLRDDLAGTGLLSPTELDTLERAPRETGEPLVRAMARAGVVPEEKLLRGLAQCLGLG